MTEFVGKICERVGKRILLLAGFSIAVYFWAAGGAFASTSGSPADISPQLLALIVFAACTAIGTIAIVAGTGGGVLFTTLFMGFTSIHPDIVRATGLMAAVCGTRIGARRYLRKGTANMRVVLFLGTCYTCFAVIGAMCGLSITKNFGETGVAVIKLTLGLIVILVGIMYIMVKGSAYPVVKHVDGFTSRLGLAMEYWEESLQKPVSYQVTRGLPALLLICVVGFISGSLGLGAGWAITPLFNLVMLMPIKVAAASSAVIISLGDTAAVFPYLMSDSLFPIFVVPTIAGLILGAEIGSRIAVRVKPQIIRYVLIAIMIGTGAKLLVTALRLLI